MTGRQGTTNNMIYNSSAHHRSALAMGSTHTLKIFDHESIMPFRVHLSSDAETPVTLDHCWMIHFWPLKYWVTKLAPSSEMLLVGLGLPGSGKAPADVPVWAVGPMRMGSDHYSVSARATPRVLLPEASLLGWKVPIWRNHLITAIPRFMCRQFGR